MEKQLNCVLCLPLEELALRRLVIILWKQVLAESEVNYSYLYCMVPRASSWFRQQWLTRSIAGYLLVVRKKLSQLALPKSLQKKATSVIKPIGLEIGKWMQIHCYFFENRRWCSEKIFDSIIFDKFFWTSFGTINYRNTAEELIRSEVLDCFVLYKLACFYCLEDYIPLLLVKFPDLRECYSAKTNHLQTGQAHLENFWYVLRNFDLTERQFRKSTNFYQCTFKKSALIGNKAAAEYFYQKLTNGEREFLLFETAQEVAEKNDSLRTGHDSYLLPIGNLSHVLCYLLSKMTPEQQMDLLKMHPRDVLRSYLQWPWQDLFLDVAELAWDFLSVADYCDILSDLSGKESNSGYLNMDLFREFFLRTPSNLKKSYIVEESRIGCILPQYFAIGRPESIKVVFRNIDAASKLRLAFSDQGFKICCRLVREGLSDLLRLFIQEARLSKEDMVRLKEKWKSRFSNRCERWYEPKIPDWERFLQVYDEGDGNASSKRSFAEDERGAKFRKT